ncbi:MAG: class I adenylate-forming enzyme family protein [Methyloligellaceae bacterium]
MYLGELLDRNARYRPDHMGVIFKDRRLTYSTFDADVNRLANALNAKGFQKGDRIATILPNCLELLTLFWAAAKTGIVVVPVSPLLQEVGLFGLFSNARPTGYFVSPDHDIAVRAVNERIGSATPDRIFTIGGSSSASNSYEALVEGASSNTPTDITIDGQDLFNIFYTSGTTGEPKGIMHSHHVRSMYGTLFANAWRMTPESVVLHSGALIYNGAFVTMLPCFFSAGTFIFHEAFEPAEVIATIAREKVTHIMLVPSQITALLNAVNYESAKLQTLEMLLSLGAPLHLEIKKKFAYDVPGRFYELYGVTEGFITFLDKTDFDKKPSSVGVPMQFNEIRIADDKGAPLPTGEIGEIIGRGPMMMAGYYDRPDLTASTIKNGWIHSGDLGYVDKDGFLYLVDRKKDMIISGGVNVYPRDIEEVIVRHPAIKETAVFGVAHEKWGETPIAAVTLQTGERQMAADLKSWINDHVPAKFQRVYEVLVVNEFPRNAAGKILKRTLREAYETGAFKKMSESEEGSR